MDNNWIKGGLIALVVVFVESLFSIYTQLTLDNAQNAEDKRYNLQIEINTRDIAVIKEKLELK